jgi:hypothetical protein
MNNIIRMKQLPEVVESGSNSYGYYIKYRDGTMIQRGWSYVYNSSVALYGTVAVTLPQAFANTDYDVSYGSIGRKANGGAAPSSRTDINAAEYYPWVIATHARTTSGFTAAANYAPNSNFDGYIVFSWVAVGIWSSVYTGTGPVISIGRGIIEAGANANGNYVKYEDGTMECWGTTPVVAPSVPGNTYSFPYNFVAAPVMTAIGTGVNRSAVAEALTCYPSISTSTFTLAHGYAASQAIMWTAIGRWQSAASMVGSYTYGQGIVETGSNSNGNWIKYDNGTMECWNYNATTVTTSSGFGNIWASPASTLFTFPASFIAVPLIMPLCKPTVAAPWGSIDPTTISATQVTIYVIGGGSNNAGYPGYRALGRWK